MYSFVLQSIVFTSLGVVVYMMARALPRVSDVEPRKGPRWVERLMNRVPTEKIDQGINSFLVKFLRKFKLVVLKLDNFIGHRLGKLSKKTTDSGEKKDGDQQLL